MAEERTRTRSTASTAGHQAARAVGFQTGSEALLMLRDSCCRQVERPAKRDQTVKNGNSGQTEFFGAV
jgi:hypothetical protein